MAAAFLLFTLFNYLGLIQTLRLFHALLDEIKLSISDLGVLSPKLKRLLTAGPLPMEKSISLGAHLLADTIMLYMIFTLF